LDRALSSCSTEDLRQIPAIEVAGVIGAFHEMLISEDLFILI
jgi:hypothetical protein